MSYAKRLMRSHSSATPCVVDVACAASSTRLNERSTALIAEALHYVANQSRPSASHGVSVTCRHVTHSYYSGSRKTTIPSRPPHHSRLYHTLSISDSLGDRPVPTLAYCSPCAFLAAGSARATPTECSCLARIILFGCAIRARRLHPQR